jgi:hypothetical protein
MQSPQSFFIETMGDFCNNEAEERLPKKPLISRLMGIWTGREVIRAGNGKIWEESMPAAENSVGSKCQAISQSLKSDTP